MSATEAQNLSSPYTASDAIFNSGAGIAFNFATDFYADHIIETSLAKSIGLGEKLLPDPSITHTNPLARSIVDKHIAAQEVSYKSRSHFFRQRWKNSSIFNKLGITYDGKKRTIAGLIKDLDHMPRVFGARAALPELIATEGIDEALKGSLRHALKARSFGVAAMTFGLAQVGFELGSSITNSLAAKGRAVRTRGNAPMMASAAFQDTKMAYTSRQHAMRAIQLGQSGLKRSLGNEASFLHGMG